MGWRWPLAALMVLAIPVAWPFCQTPDPEYEPCGGSFDATFLQLDREQRTFDEARWLSELAIVRDLGVRLVIVQYTGDEHGLYDRAGHAPVASLLAAASVLGIDVMIGLSDDPTWPSDRAVTRLAPPLEDPRSLVVLGDLCTTSPACAGWYISQEIDEQTWAGTERTAALREHLSRTAHVLRTLTPNKQIAISPFFVGALEPADYAHWWLDVLVPGAVDILILQDGVGTGRSTPQQAAQYLLALTDALCKRSVHVWAVAETFHQLHGTPIDHRPFAAIPLDPARLHSSLTAEAPIVERVVAFAVLPYMDPRRGGEARRLHDAYAACRAAPGVRRPPC